MEGVIKYPKFPNKNRGKKKEKLKIVHSFGDQITSTASVNPQKGKAFKAIPEPSFVISVDIPFIEK